jgi:hypothetical protein
MSRRNAVTSAVVLLLIAGLAWAQPPQGPRRPPGPGFGGPGMGGRGFGGPGMPVTLVSLVGMPEVQQELGLSDQQKKDVGELVSETQNQLRAAMSGVNFQELQDMSDEERGQVLDGIRKKTEEANKQADEKLAKLLEEEQRDRLNQLRLQREGIAALGRAEIAKELGLSEDQTAKIRDIQEKGRPQFGGPGGPDQDPGEAMARIEKQREKVQADVLAALSDQQRAKWAEMKGKEFKFPPPQFGFGPGGRGGPGVGPAATERVRPPIKKRDK